MTDETTAVARAEQGRAMAGAAGLGREMGRAYRQAVAFYRREMGLAEADALARDPAGADVARIEETPPDQLDWLTLGRVAELDPERARAAWERAQAAARDEWMSGHRAATSMEASGTPWERAQNITLVQLFVEDWQPRGAVEAALVESLAQAYAAQLAWMARLSVRSSAEAQREDREIAQGARWTPPTLEAAAAIDQAAAMVDRFNRLFLRTLRALRDLRRYAPSVVVGHVDQLNLAQTQLNVAQAEAPPERRGGGPLETIVTEMSSDAHED